MNTDAERKATAVRLRAERRAGEMLAENERAAVPNPAGNNQVTVHGEPQPKSEFQQAKKSAGISDNQSKRWQKLAAVDPILEVRVFPNVLKVTIRRRWTHISYQSVALNFP